MLRAVGIRDDTGVGTKGEIKIAEVPGMNGTIVKILVVGGGIGTTDDELLLMAIVGHFESTRHLSCLVLFGFGGRLASLSDFVGRLLSVW